MQTSERKIDFYRQYLKHYGEAILNSADNDKIIADLISNKDLGNLYNSLRAVIDVDWHFSEK